MSGWNILQRINEDPKLRHIKVHVMSAYDKETLGQPMDQEEYIPKPVTLEMLDKAFGKIRQSGSTIQTVLVVEDNEGENRAIAELLLAHGITSVSAFSGKEAQRLLKQERVDCIILDLNLPDTGGYELMENIRVSGRNLPIIIYSGKDLTEDEEFRLKKYANTIIIKNQFSYIRLLDEVQLFLHKINDKLPGEQEFKMKLHIPEEVLKDKKVLVVDDDVRNVYSLYNLLEQYQMKIVVANDGKEALEKVETENGLDIILMDMMMPEMDGAEAIRQIRKNPALARLPIIALTAKAMKGDKERCIEAGASDYISKPIDVSKLLALMRVWLYKGI
jgi:CheY-like chemotaxis protein